MDDLVHLPEDCFASHQLALFVSSQGGGIIGAHVTGAARDMLDDGEGR